MSLNDKKSVVVITGITILVLFILLIAGAYYWVSKKTKGQTVYPAGINYLGPTSSEVKTPVAPLYDYEKLANSSNWVTFKGRLFGYSFQYPKEMVALAFPPNDPSDAVTFKVGDTPPELNLMLLVETISSRDSSLVGKPEEYVKNYWRFFSGLKGVNKVTVYQNAKGLKGYKASYLTKANTVTPERIFFILDGDPDHMIYVSNIFPKEGEAVFNRMLNSLEYKKK